MTEIPVFPAGVLKIYQNPNPPDIPSMDEFEFNQDNSIEFDEEYRSPGWDRYKKNKILKTLNFNFSRMHFHLCIIYIHKQNKF